MHPSPVGANADLSFLRQSFLPIPQQPGADTWLCLLIPTAELSRRPGGAFLPRDTVPASPKSALQALSSNQSFTNSIIFISS